MLLLSLGELLIAAKGLAAPDVGDVYVQAYRLCHRLGEPPQCLQVLQGLCRFHLTRAQLSAAGALAQEVTDLVHRQHEAGPCWRARQRWAPWRSFVATRGRPGPPGALLLLQ